MDDHMEEDHKEETKPEAAPDSRLLYDGFSPDYLRIYYGTSSCSLSEAHFFLARVLCVLCSVWSFTFRFCCGPCVLTSFSGSKC